MSKKEEAVQEPTDIWFDKCFRSDPPAAPVQESDCVLVPRYLVGAACAAIVGKRDAPKTLEQLRRYTTGDLSTPPAQPAVPLTDEQIDQVANSILTADPVHWWRQLARAIEAAHGITKGGAA